MDSPAATHKPLTMTPRQAAYELGLSRSFIYRLMKAGTIPTTVVGKRARIVTTDLLAYLDAGRRPTA
jgi:excisionase family DNA binding protein